MKSYQKQVREHLQEFAELNLTDSQVAAGLMTELIRVLTVIADELHEFDRKQKVIYFCDGKKCEQCSPECRYTTDLQHAANFDLQDGVFVEGRTKWRDSTRGT
ncbi:MAG: hypothetical protein IJV59_07550 [Eubacterium sp.]|nr:hypothetical protein [Eubacterium sp.]